jgi:hypothetical protein
MLRITTSGASEITVTSRNVEVKTADTTIKYSIPSRKKKPKVATQVTVYAQNATVYSQNATVNVKRIRQRVATEPEPEVEEPEVEEPEVVEPVELVEPELVEPEVEEPEVKELRTIYSPSEVALMENDELESKFCELTGIHSLDCSRCGHKYKKPVRNFINAIRKRCMKKVHQGHLGGLHKDMVIPLTCDKTLASNTEKNPINSKIYPKLKKADEAEQRELQSKRATMYKELLGKEIKPYKYVM